MNYEQMSSTVESHIYEDNIGTSCINSSIYKTAGGYKFQKFQAILLTYMRMVNMHMDTFEQQTYRNRSSNFEELCSLLFQAVSVPSAFEVV